MTTNARDEKWSEWVNHDGKSVPLDDKTKFEYRMRGGTALVAMDKASDYRPGFIHKDSGSDIIAYRYKIKEPESMEVTDAEEEAWQAKEREQSTKQLRYQDARGEDWIDEFARTKSVDEFRGAMSFNIGKYNRRAGKKDDINKELDKIIDYCQRWKAYELGLKG